MNVFIGNTVLDGCLDQWFPTLVLGAPCPVLDENEWVVIQLCRSLLMTIRLNQVCWSRETSKTGRTGVP